MGDYIEVSCEPVSRERGITCWEKVLKLVCGLFEFFLDLTASVVGGMGSLVKCTSKWKVVGFIVEKSDT